MSDLRVAQEIIADRLEEIRRVFKPGAKVTLIVRNPGTPGDTDMILGNDDFDEAVKALTRLRATRPEETI